MRLATRWGCFALVIAVLAAMACPGAAVAQPLVTGNLTLYYDFESLGAGDGNEVFGVLADGSGNGFDADIHVGDPEFDLTPGTFGIDGSDPFRGVGAGQFVQSEDSFDLPVYADVRGEVITADHFDKLPAATNAVTYAAWIKTTKNDSGDQGIFEARTSDAGHGVPHFQLQGNGKLRTTFRNQTGDTVVNAPQVFIDGTEDSGIKYPVDEWFHYASTYDKSTDTWVMYYNGVAIASGASEPGTDGNLGDWGGQKDFGDFFAAGFGAVYDSGGRRFDGLLDELYVFNRALDASEIAKLAMVGTSGDLDGDGDVDGNDFLKWQTDDASAAGLADIVANFGNVGGQALVAAVPEPASLVMVMMGSLALLVRRRQF